jgi:hypothetical protein
VLVEEAEELPFEAAEGRRVVTDVDGAELGDAGDRPAASCG